MSLQIVKGSDIYNLPASFCLTDLSFNKRINIGGKAYMDGGVNKGDGMFAVRYFQLEGSLWGESDSAYDTKFDELILKLSQEDFYLRDGNWQILINHAHAVDHSPDPGLRKRNTEISFKMVALNPFWYYRTITTITEECSETPHDFVINNINSYLIYPVITITANINNSSFSLKNKTDGNALFSYEDIGFLEDDELIIDCQEGTVEREGTDSIRYFDGQFLKLLAGNNELEYTGVAVTLKFEWYRRKL
ncbi:MAG: phage tail family protein [Candidatus Omnitrophica bacterium]|nr:phage tail family protein [Candidatus Omnitrophota bacterium]